LGLRDISLKEEYRSDRDDIISEFFIPCLSNCIEYDRCIEYVTIKSLTTLALGFDNFAKNKAKLRMITGHRFNASDLELLNKLFSEQTSDVRFNSKFIRDSKIQMLKEIVANHRLEIKIAIPNSEEVAGSFSEKIGIFLDKNDDVVAFTGTSNETFNTQNKNFESVDVFTSWNDKSRIDIKIKDFEDLWENNTKYVEVYDFNYAEKNHLLKYSSQWALDIV
jgi:HKD family nuclease